jgi:hypothetical protein
MEVEDHRMPRCTLTGTLVFLACISSAQEVKPDFAGRWRVVDAPSNRKAAMEIKQSSNTLEMRPVLDGASAHWIVYPTDGTETKEKVGNATFFRSGHWDGVRLILESRKDLYRKGATIQEVVSMTENGRLKTSFHVIGGDSRHDYTLTSEKLKE